MKTGEETDLIQLCETEAENAVKHLEENYRTSVEVPGIEIDSNGVLNPYIGLRRRIVRRLPFLNIERPRAGYVTEGVNLLYDEEKNELDFDIQNERILVNNEGAYNPETIQDLMSHEVGHAAVNQNNWFMALRPGYLDEQVLDGIDEAAAYMTEYAVVQDTGFFETPEIPEKSYGKDENHVQGLDILEEHGRTVLTDPRTVYENITGEDVSLEEYVHNFTTYMK